MANKPFKMKGSPMKRNFGIGADSPMKQETTPSYQGVNINPRLSYNYKSAEIPSFRDLVSLEQQQAYADKVDKRRDSRKQTKDMRKEFKGTRKDFRKGNKEEIAELKTSGASRKEIKDARKLNRQEQRDLRGSHMDDIRAERKSIEKGWGKPEEEKEEVTTTTSEAKPDESSEEQA